MMKKIDWDFLWVIFLQILLYLSVGALLVSWCILFWLKV